MEDFFARTTVIRSNSTQHCGYSVTFCKDDWDSVSIKIFASSFTFWFELSGQELLPLPAHCTIPTLSFTSFCGNELVSVSCFFFSFSFSNQRHFPLEASLADFMSEALVDWTSLWSIVQSTSSRGQLGITGVPRLHPASFPPCLSRGSLV